MPPNAVTSPLLTLLYIEEMADQVLVMYLSGILNGWGRMMDNIVLHCDKYRVHPNFSPTNFRNESLVI